jgi:betaine-aldehyde dehydrogenase
VDTKPTVIGHFSRVAPKHRDLYDDGAWQRSHGGYRDTWSPSTDENLGPCAEADIADVDAAVGAAGRAAKSWRNSRPTERAAMLKRAATVLLEHIDELAMLDAINCGNPLAQLRGDIRAAAAMINFAAGRARLVGRWSNDGGAIRDSETMTRFQEGR